jgi:glycerol kinase
MAILALDAGTTGVTALVVSEAGEVISRGYREFLQYFPAPGWVEHEPKEIWQATLAAASDAISQSQQALSAIGITNQRETVAIWHRESLKSARRAIVWQDRRTAEIVQHLQDSGLEERIRSLTGLGLDPYFSSSKLLWLAKNEPELWKSVQNGELVVGTIDSYLIARLTGGDHITDASNASRTQLLDIKEGSWSNELLEIFSVPKSALAKVVPSYGKLAVSDPAHFLNLSLPICGVAGDQQAALFGQAAFQVGESKCTYGTGAFMLTNTGSQIIQSRNGLLGTIAWQHPDGEIEYALEGSVFVAGAAVQWLRDGLELIQTASQVEDLASSVGDSAGVVFVPALTGLGAPHWDPAARGTIFGITRGTTKAHIARATLEAIAFGVRDLITAIQSDTATTLKQLRVDGGAAGNDLLMQLQADSLQVPVIRGANLESTGIGAAFLAGLGSGIWSSKEELRGVYRIDRVFEPAAFDERAFANWSKAVRLARSW